MKCTPQVDEIQTSRLQRITQIIGGSEMNMPGFTAENALYNTHTKYSIPNPASERLNSGLGACKVL